MADSRRLYGQPSDEHLHADIEKLIQQMVDDGYDPGEYVVEESTVKPQPDLIRLVFPDHARIVEWLGEWVADSDWCAWSELAEDVDRALAQDEVKGILDRLVEFVAGEVSFMVADGKVAEHTVTIPDRSGPVLLDGEPSGVEVEIEPPPPYTVQEGAA